MPEQQQRLDGSLINKKKFGRVQSPSSINTYRKCPRKYYYHYIAGLPTKTSIQLIKGGVIHSVLEDFYDIDIARYDEKTVHDELRIAILKLFLVKWKEAEGQISKIGITNIEEHTNDCLAMLSSWAEWYLGRLTKKMQQGISLAIAFKELTPIREQEYVSDEHAVRGFIDAIHHDDEEVKIIDYKTTSSDDMSDEYYLQLAIYALLYRIRHGKLPATVGLHFLRFGEKHLDATEAMVNFAEETISTVHSKTTTTDIKDYPKNIHQWCKYCDFFSTCNKDP